MIKNQIVTSLKCFLLNNRVDMWKEGSKILFECKVKETGTLCLTGGWIELRNDGKEVQSSNPKLGLKSESIFDELTARLKAKPGNIIYNKFWTRTAQ